MTKEITNDQTSITYMPSSMIEEEETLRDKKYSSGSGVQALKVSFIAVGIFIIVIIIAIVLYFALPKNKNNFDDLRLIELKVGQIKGSFKVSNYGGKVYEYLGIPYAKPPIGKLRFKDPQPIDPWTNVISALSHGNSCICPIDLTYGSSFLGSTMWNPTNKLDEDCLYLNIWRPAVKDHKQPSLAVMVFIYGGGFYSGSSQLEVYDGKVLADSQQVIVVSFNYRLGAFGFLTTGDDRITGNFGIKDQQLALKFIKENIDRFGGDSENITIFGESAGSVSVGLHLSLESSKSYFKRAIMQSGAPNSYWSVWSLEQARKQGYLYLKKINCSLESKNFMDCLLKKTSKQLNDFIFMQSQFFYIPFAPYVDGKFIKNNSYKTLLDKSYQNKSILMGTNSDEGTFWIVYALKSFSKDNSSEIDYNTYKSSVKASLWDLTKMYSNDVIEKVIDFYKPTNISNKALNRDAIDDVVGDRLFKCPLKLWGRSYAASGNDIYFYEISYRPSNEVWPKWMGFIHGGELQYIFGWPFNKTRNFNDDDRRFSKIIMKYWSNFAKTGNPNLPLDVKSIYWDKVHRHDANVINYLQMKSPDDYQMNFTDYKRKQCELWNELSTLTSVFNF